jgi:hypothetical protein
MLISKSKNCVSNSSSRFFDQTLFFTLRFYSTKRRNFSHLSFNFYSRNLKLEVHFGIKDKSPYICSQISSIETIGSFAFKAMYAHYMVIKTGCV